MVLFRFLASLTIIGLVQIAIACTATPIPGCRDCGGTKHRPGLDIGPCDGPPPAPGGIIADPPGGLISERLFRALGDSPQAQVGCFDPQHSACPNSTLRICCGSGWMGHFACLARIDPANCSVFFVCTSRCCPNSARIADVKVTCDGGGSPVTTWQECLQCVLM